MRRKVSIFVIIFGGLALFVSILGAAILYVPIRAFFAHRSIAVGMTVEEAVRHLDRYGGGRVYRLQSADLQSVKECDHIYSVLDNCKNAKISDGKCLNLPRITRYVPDSCEFKLESGSEFASVIQGTSENFSKNSHFFGEILVIHVGPVFLKNTFSVHFDAGGKIDSITRLERWD